MSKNMLTTFDNPYSPFDNFKRWWNFDTVHGYYTCQRLANVSKSIVDFSENAPEFMVDEVTQEAMERLVEADFLNLFQIVKESDYKDGIRIPTQDTKDLRLEIESREKGLKD